MKNLLTIVKVGGGVVEDPESLARLLDSFCSVATAKLLVHGGGRKATALAARLGIETRMIDGRRITDEATLRVATMVYGGLVNKQIVARLQARGVDAIGLTGADMGIIRAHRRPVTGGIDYGFVGDIDAVDPHRLGLMLREGLTPVLAPLTFDPASGSLLNTNADTIAQAVAVSMAKTHAVRLVYCFEKAGVMTDPANPASVIPRIDARSFARLKDDGAVSGGMIPKIENAIRAVAEGVEEAAITSFGDIDAENGTVIRG